MLIGAHLASCGLPSNEVARHAQYLRSVAERLVHLETVLFGLSAVVQCDQAILDDLERDLVLDLLDTEALRSLVLDDKAFDLVVVQIARPDDRNVAPRRIADPLLLAVQDPGVALAFRGGHEAAARS